MNPKFRHVRNVIDFYFDHCAPHICAEADGEGTAEVSVYQEGKEELVPD